MGLRAGRRLVRSGLPLEDPAPSGESALGRARRSLAWTERAIAELERRTPALVGKRAGTGARTGSRAGTASDDCAQPPSFLQAASFLAASFSAFVEYC